MEPQKTISLNPKEDPEPRVKWLAYLLSYVFPFILFVAPVIIVVSYGYFKIEAEMTTAVYTGRQTTADIAMAVISNKFDGLIDIGKSFATRPSILLPLKEGRWDDAAQTLKDIPADFSIVERIILTDQSGTLMADTPALPGVRGVNFAERDWYKGVTRTGKPYVSEAYKRTGQPEYNVVAVAIPVKAEDGAELGILALQIRLDTIFDWSQTIKVEGEELVYFVDQKGQAAVHPKFSLVNDIIDMSQAPAVIKVLNGERGVAILYDPVEKEEQISAYEQDPVYGWGVVVQQPTRTAFQARANVLSNILLPGVVIILFNILIAFLFLRNSKKVREYFRREQVLLGSIGDAVIAIDRNWNIILWNKSASRLSGWTKEETKGKPFRNFIKLIRESDRSDNTKFIVDVMVTGQLCSLENHTLLIRKDGKEIAVGDSAALILNEKKEVAGVIIIMRDATKEQDASLLHSDFAYASHQLRTPVTKALWILETVLDEEDVKKIKENTRIAYESLESVKKLSEELIDVSEIDQGTISPKIKMVKLTNLFDDAVKVVSKKALKHEVKITVPVISVTSGIDTDQKLLERALVEILDNAIIYSPGKSEVKVNITYKEDSVFIEIQDFGLGITSEQQPLVFTKFFRGSNYDTAEIMGAGLGLFIAKEYVKLLKGKIWFKSEEKKGTIFYMSFPLTGVRDKKA